MLNRLSAIAALLGIVSLTAAGCGLPAGPQAAWLPTAPAAHNANRFPPAEGNTSQDATVTRAQSPRRSPSPAVGSAPRISTASPIGTTFGQGYPDTATFDRDVRLAQAVSPGSGPYPDTMDLPQHGYADPMTPWDIFVEETQTGRFRFGVGVNSDAGVTGSIVIDEQNFDWRRFPRSWSDWGGNAFRGGGQRFTIEALPGTRVQRYSFRFIEPYLNNTNTSLSLSASFYDRRFDDWDEQRVGVRVSVGRNLTPNLSASATFRAANVNIHDPRVPTQPDLMAVLGDNSLVGFGARLRHDTRDSTFLATQGHLIQLEFEQVVGTFSYPRFNLDMRKHFMLHERADSSGRHVLSLRGRLAISGKDTPIYERYFAGGFSTLRGFDFRGASPRSGGVTVGGELMLLGSVEYLFPITDGDVIYGVVFTDFGTVEEVARLHTDAFRVAPGFGLRISVPAMGPAPIALDFAFPVASEDGDETRVFSIFMGFFRG